MKTTDSDPAQLRQCTAAMKEFICVINCRQVCLGIRAITDLIKVIYEVFFTNSWCPGAKVPPSEHGWNSAADTPWDKRLETLTSLFCLALVIAPCLQDHCLSVKLDWKWADGLVVTGVEKWHAWALCKKIELKINGLKAKTLLCTHLFQRVEEESAEMWQVPVTLLRIFLEED